MAKPNKSQKPNKPVQAAKKETATAQPAKKTEVIETVEAEEVKPTAAHEAKQAELEKTFNDAAVAVPSNEVNSKAIILAKILSDDPNQQVTISGLAGAMGVEFKTKGARLSVSDKTSIVNGTARFLETMPDKNSALYQTLHGRTAHGYTYLNLLMGFQLAEEMQVGHLEVRPDMVELTKLFFGYYGTDVSKALSEAPDSNGQYTLDFSKAKMTSETKEAAKVAVDTIVKDAEGKIEKNPTKWDSPEKVKEGLTAILVNKDNDPPKNIMDGLEATKVYLKVSEPDNAKKSEIDKLSPGQVYEEMLKLIVSIPVLVLNGLSSMLRGITRSQKLPIGAHLKAKSFWGAKYNDAEVADLVKAIFKTMAKRDNKPLEEFLPWKSLTNESTREYYLEIAQYPDFKEGPHNSIVSGLLNVYPELPARTANNFSIEVVNKLIALDSLYAEGRDRFAMYEEKGYPEAPQPLTPKQRKELEAEEAKKKAEETAATGASAPVVEDPKPQEEPAATATGSESSDQK